MSKIFGSFRAKVTIALVLSLFFVAVLINVLIYQFSLKSQLNQFRESLKTIAQISALSVDPALLAQVPLNRDGVATEPYKLIAEKLNEIKRTNPQILFIYTLTRTDKKGIWQFIVDPEPSGRDKNGKGPTSYPGDIYEASYFPEMMKAFDGPSADKKLMVDKWGATLSGYAPIRDRNGRAVAVLGIDISAKDIYALHKELDRRALFVFLIGIIFSVGLGVLVSKRATDPVKRLEEATYKIAAGDLSHKVEVKGDDEINRLASSFNKMAQSLSESRKALQDYFYRAVQSLVRSLEAKDSYTKGHSDRVAEYAQKIALEMGFSQEEAEVLKKAAQLHDIGKMGIDDRILNKVEKLTYEEWDMIKKHPEIGEDILKPIFLDQKMLALVRSHHEHYDGTGYPDGLKGDAINIPAQIVSVADSYDAMTSKRAYRDSLGKEKAVEEIEKNSGTQFNPKVVEAFLKVLNREGI